MILSARKSRNVEITERPDDADEVPMNPRRIPPGADERTRYGEPMCFRVWAREPSHSEDSLPWKCSACFRFLLECLDYIAYCQDAGVEVVFQSPAETKLIKPSDRRVVALAGDTLRRPRQPRSGFSVDGGEGERLLAEAAAL